MLISKSGNQLQHNVIVNRRMSYVNNPSSLLLLNDTLYVTMSGKLNGYLNHLVVIKMVN